MDNNDFGAGGVDLVLLYPAAMTKHYVLLLSAIDQRWWFLILSEVGLHPAKVQLLTHPWLSKFLAPNHTKYLKITKSVSKRAFD